MKVVENKPWAILKVTRKEYCTAFPWKKANMPRANFEELLALLPDGFVEQIHLEAEAERQLVFRS